MSYSKEKTKLLAHMDPAIQHLLEVSGCVIAGGAITSIFNGREVNDLDIYIPNEQSLLSLLASIFDIDEYRKEEDITKYQCHVLNYSDKSITFLSGGIVYQIIAFNYFNKIEDIFDAFDFTCCMGAYDFTTGEFVLHEDFLKHNSQRYLKFNSGTAYPLISLLRVDKYEEKGYKISKAEFIRIALAVKSLELSTWKEAREHIGGMYGVPPENLFDETKEFSLEELSSQIEEVSDAQLDYFNVPNIQFEGVIKSFISIDNDDELEIVFNTNYNYKTVNGIFTVDRITGHKRGQRDTKLYKKLDELTKLEIVYIKLVMPLDSPQ